MTLIFSFIYRQYWKIMEETNNYAKQDLKGQLDTIKKNLCATKHDETSNEIYKETKTKIDAILAQVDESHELCLNLILIKAFCILSVARDLMECKPEEFIRSEEPNLIECQTLMKPFKNRAEGVLLYVVCQVLYVKLIKMRNEDKPSQSVECQAEYREGFKMIEDADKHYTDFVHYNMEKPWGIDEIFCYRDDAGNLVKLGITEDFRKFREDGIKFLLMEFAIKTLDNPKIRKYGVDGLKSFLNRNRSHTMVYNLVQGANIVTLAFINDHYYAQAQHIIAVIMHTVVEFRRALPEEERTTVNPIQYEVSYMYALLGSALIRKSHELINQQQFYPCFGLLPTDISNTYHDDYLRLMPESAALNQYENQFLGKLTLDEKNFKKIQKKTRQWLARMEELKRTSTAPQNDCPSLERSLPKIEAFSQIPYLSFKIEEVIP